MKAFLNTIWQWLVQNIFSISALAVSYLHYIEIGLLLKLNLVQELIELWIYQQKS